MAAGRKTGGRVAGTPNRSNKDIRDLIDGLAGAHCALYIQKLHAIAAEEHSDVHARLKAIGMLLDRRLGKVKEHVELSGDLNLKTTVVHELHP